MVQVKNKIAAVLRQVENSVMAGYDPVQDVWRPHRSPEGGTDTLGYGHKLTKEEADSGKVSIKHMRFDYLRGIPTPVIDLLFQQDLDKQEENIRRSIKDFDTLDERYQGVLLNIIFNTGRVTESSWPKLLKAMRSGDDVAVRREMVTTFKDPQGKRIKLTRRAEQVADAMEIEGSGVDVGAIA